MRLYESTLDTGQRRLIVHLDESKVIAKGDPRLGTEGFPWGAGMPDPDWTVEAVYDAYRETDAPLTGASGVFDPKCTVKGCGRARSYHRGWGKDPTAGIAHEFVGQVDPPMRKLSRAEVEQQQEDELVAIAKEALARLRAEQDQADAAGADPYADGGKRV